MPIIPDDSLQYNVGKVIDYVAPDNKKDVSFSEKLTSAARIDNEVISFISKEGSLPDGFASENYDVFSKLSEEEKLDDRFVSAAALSDNDLELEAVRRQYQREQEDRENTTGVDGFLARLLAGNASPLSIIPGGAGVKAYQAGNVLKGGLMTGAAAAGTASISEMSLQSTQLARTGDESLMNVTGAMLLGGALGSGAALINKKVLNDTAKEIEEIFDDMAPDNIVRNENDSVGAAAVWGDVKVKGKNVEKILKSLKLVDPLAEVMTAKSKMARQLGARLFENPLELEGFDGRSVEQIVKTKRQAYYGRALVGHLDAFVDQKKAGGVIKKREFNVLVGKEVANPGSTGNPFAKKAADSWIKEVYNPLELELKAVGLLGDDVDVKTAARYLNRRWNKEVIGGDIRGFKSVVSKWLIETRPDIDSPGDIAEAIAMKIMGTPDGMIPYGDEIINYKLVGKNSNLRAPFKSRDFLIPDELVERFLDRDIEQLANVYLRNTVPDMEIFRAFGDSKTPVEDVLDLRYQKEDIMREYTRMAEAAKTRKESSKLIKEGQSVIKSMAGMKDRMRGTYDVPEGGASIPRRINASFRDLNYARLLGGVLASSVPDIAKQVMAEGFYRAFGDGLIPVIRNLKKIKPIKDEFRYYGLAMDTITSGRVEQINDISSYALGNTKIERGLSYIANKASDVFLINRWNDTMKTAHGLAMQARVYDDMAAGKFDNKLSRLGLSEVEAKGIYEMAKKHGEVVNGARIFNAKNWERQDLAFAWASAIRKESDRVVIVPGQEKPLMMSNHVGQTLLQFRSFMLASTQRTMLAALQGQEANAVGGMLSMISMGAMVYAFKQWDAGREISDDPRVWIAEGIDRSGVLGIIMEGSNTIEKATGNRFGLRPLIGIDAPASRFASRNLTENLAGPTYGSAASTIARIGTAMADGGEWTPGDTRAGRRMVPLQNLSFLRQGVDKIEEAINKGL